MHTRKDEIFNIKEKSNFLYMNSGIILTKLENSLTSDETFNYLQILLLGDQSLDQLVEICCYLIHKNELVSKYKDGYNAAIRTIFYVAEQIINSDYLEEGKTSLRNKLREYTRHFECNDEDLKDNNKLVEFVYKKS